MALASPGAPSLGLGGAGTLAAATGVRVSIFLPDGALKVISEASLGANGTFSLQVPLNIDVLVAQAVDAAGRVLGSAVVGASGNVSGSVVVTAPITTQTSLQALVLIDAAG